MNDKLWDATIEKLVARLLESHDEFSAEQIHPCPICRNRLNVQIGRYQRNNAKMIGITIECVKCDKAIAADFIEG